MADSAKLTSNAVDALHEADIYEDGTESVETKETHISHLFLTREHVYKLKKPVDFGFLDYSSVDKRRASCEAEVRINRRLARGVYLAAAPVGRDKSGRWKIGGDVEAEDWLVEMKRLPEDRCLKRMISGRSWTAEDVERIVELLDQFYRSLSPERMPRYRERYRERVIENFQELQDSRHELPADLVRRVHSSQLRYLFFHADKIDFRESDGHIVEGHGDLRAEHVYLTDPPVVIDGIEFSREMRLVDTADELCFFAMTCDLLDAPELGEQALQRCCVAMNDEPPESLLNFYRTYRACVRSKVEILRTDQMSGKAAADAKRKATQLLRLADQYATQLDPPLVVIVRGLSGTGKTTLAESLAEHLAANHLSTDQIRQASGLSDQYSRQARENVYTSLFEQAAQLVGNGESVVLDGTFLKASQLNDAVEALAPSAIDVRIITCVCPEKVVLERIRRRREKGDSTSDADEAVYRKQTTEIEPVPSHLSHVELDTTLSENEMLEKLRESFAEAEAEGS